MPGRSSRRIVRSLVLLLCAAAPLSAFVPAPPSSPNTPTTTTTTTTNSMLVSAACGARARTTLPLLRRTAACFGRPSRRGLRSLASSSEPNSHDSITATNFTKGQAIQVEVVSFGPLGASVDVIGLDHTASNVLPEGALPHATGLILQREIAYFRTARRNVDVVLGEVLPAYVEGVREEEDDTDNNDIVTKDDTLFAPLPKLDVSLRVVGGKAKTDEWSAVLWDRLQEDGGQVPVGDKSSPAEIAALFPGASKGAFKKAVAKLYKEKKVEPGPYVTKLMS